MGSDLPLKILFFVPCVPNRIRTRPFHLLKALVSKGHRVTLATLWSSREELVAVQQLAENLDGILAERIGISQTLWNNVRALPTSHPVQAFYSWSPTLARKLIRIVATKAFDVDHIEHLRGVRYGLLVKDVLARKGIRHPPCGMGQCRLHQRTVSSCCPGKLRHKVSAHYQD